jgi:hypothetical protein
MRGTAYCNLSVSSFLGVGLIRPLSQFEMQSVGWSQFQKGNMLYQNKPLDDGTVLVIVSDQPVSLEHVKQAFIATAEQFAQAKAEPVELENKPIDIGEWKAKKGLK